MKNKLYNDTTNVFLDNCKSIDKILDYINSETKHILNSNFVSDTTASKTLKAYESLKEVMTIEKQEALLKIAINNKKKFTNEIFEKYDFSYNDIKDFKSILFNSLCYDDAINSYWDLDTFAREEFMQIIQDTLSDLIKMIKDLNRKD